jgi:hypothetical protein
MVKVACDGRVLAVAINQAVVLAIDSSRSFAYVLLVAPRKTGA